MLETQGHIINSGILSLKYYNASTKPRDSLRTQVFSSAAVAEGFSTDSGIQ